MQAPPSSNQRQPEGPEASFRPLRLYSRRGRHQTRSPYDGSAELAVELSQRSTSPLMNDSTASRAWSSKYWTGGDFMKYDDADRIGPPMPRSRAIFAQRSASMMTPAEFGESQTSSLYSRFSGTSPKARPSSRTYAHLRSSSQAT